MSAEDETRFVAQNKISEFERLAAEIDQIDHRGVAGRVIEFDGNQGLIIGGGGAGIHVAEKFSDIVTLLKAQGI